MSREQITTEMPDKNNHLTQAADGGSRSQTFTIQQALDLAVKHHAAGELSKAEGIYNQIIQADPNQPQALHLLGVIVHQGGENEKAVELIEKALKIKPDYAEACYNLGLVLQEQGRLEEAVSSYRKALTFKADYAEAHNNLGLALQEKGQFAEAIVSYKEALSIDPNFAQAYNNLGLSLQRQGKTEEAAFNYRKALDLRSDYADAHNNLGTALYRLKKLDEALSCYQNAIELRPEFAEAHYNKGMLLYELGNLLEASNFCRRAIALHPENEKFWIGFAKSIENLSFQSADDRLFVDLFKLLEQPSVSSSEITPSIISALYCHPMFSRLQELVCGDQNRMEFSYNVISKQLSQIPLLLRIMQLNPIYDLELERMFTLLRCSLLKATIAGAIDEGGLLFSVALALQCFTNEYVFAESDEEKKALKSLQSKIAVDLEKGKQVLPSDIVTLGAYIPLHKFPQAPNICECKWYGDIQEVVVRQILEPQEELSLYSQIPDLSSIRNGISHSVREQFEEHRWPLWVKAGLYKTSTTLKAVLEGPPLNFRLDDYVSPERPDVLIAGCGTGQHALGTASRFSNSRVLAVDLSLSSLSYAMRKTKELGLSNIEYARADIMEMSNLGRHFDLIECVGVLHHLEDPIIGWRVLLDLLRPRGFMKIGLYSEKARQCIVSWPKSTNDNKYTTSVDDIRRCRQDIISLMEDGNAGMARITNMGNFFSISGCRDLLFPAQEHRYDLPQLEKTLMDLGLKFLGFEQLGESVKTAFRELHPEEYAETSLSLWHEFELNNPDIFLGMYVFWCQKL